MTPQQLAKRFHNYYESLAPTFGYETRTETRRFDPTSKQGELMIEVCRLIFLDLGMEAENQP